MCGDLVTLLINTGHTMKESTGHQKKGASLYSLQDDTAFTRRSTTNNSSFNNLFVNLDLIVIGLVTIFSHDKNTNQMIRQTSY